MPWDSCKTRKCTREKWGVWCKWDESSLIQRTRVSAPAADAQSLTLVLMNGIMALACCWRSERIKYEARPTFSPRVLVRSGALSTALLSRSIASALLVVLARSPLPPTTREQRERKMIFHAIAATQPSAAAGSHSTPHRWLLEFPATRLVFHSRELWSRRRWWICFNSTSRTARAFDFLRWFNLYPITENCIECAWDAIYCWLISLEQEQKSAANALYPHTNAGNVSTCYVHCKISLAVFNLLCEVYFL
jgi:hypothetical protein